MLADGVRGCAIHSIGAYIVLASRLPKLLKSDLSPSHSFTPVLSKFPVSVLTCTSHPLTVAQSYPLAHLVSTCHCVPALSGAKEVGTLPQSFISFPVAQSNTAKCQSVELAGQLTSPVPVQASPLGIQKFNTAALDVPTLVTVAELPGASVVVVPTVIVAASQSAHGVQSSPSFHGSHLAH